MLTEASKKRATTEEAIAIDVAWVDIVRVDVAVGVAAIAAAANFYRRRQPRVAPRVPCEEASRAEKCWLAVRPGVTQKRADVTAGQLAVAFFRC